MIWLLRNFHSVSEALTRFDGGPGGNELISYREFVRALNELGFRSFSGPDEEARIRDVFRHLETSGEGSISRCEWDILSQLWQEMMLSLEEFVKFLWMSYEHSACFLDDAWDALDEDLSGEISEAEWHSVVKERLRFFGPSMMIFHYLDVRGTGQVSAKDFHDLARFHSNGGKTEFMGH